MTSAEPKAKATIGVELQGAVSRLLQLVAAHKETVAVAEDLASHAITTAILEAENAKLEEAARLLDRNRDYMLERRRDQNAQILAKLASELAGDIRSLISKKD